MPYFFNKNNLNNIKKRVLPITKSFKVPFINKEDNITKWIEDGMPPYIVDLIKRFSDTFDSTITIMIETCEKNNI